MVLPPMPETWARYYTKGDDNSNKIYMASSLGNVMSIDLKTGKKHILKKKKIRGNETVWIRQKKLFVSRIIWTAFNGPVPDGYSIFHKNRISHDNELINLELATKEEIGRLTGFRSNARPVYCADNDTYYRSAREAGIHLHCSYNTILNICKGKTKKPMYNVWFSDEIKSGKKRTKPLLRK